MEATRQPYRTLQIVDDEDLEDGSISIQMRNGIPDDKELVSFIEKYSAASDGFHDFYLHSLRDFFGSNHLQSQAGLTCAFWVENPVAGNFVAVQPNKTISKVKMQNTTKKSEQPPQSSDEHDNILENTPLIPKLDTADLGQEEGAKTLFVPPPAPVLNDINSTYQADPWTLVTMEYRNFAFVKRCIFLIFQGFLGGFCVVTVFLQRTANSSNEFLLHYQPMSQEVRRYFYILSSVSLVGSLDYLISSVDLYSPRNPFSHDAGVSMIHVFEDYQKFSIAMGILVLILHSISFICAMLMSSFDVQVYLKDNKSSFGNEWIVQAMQTSSFKNDFNSWTAFQNVRAITALIAWIGCCYLLWRDIARFSKLWLSLKRVRQHALSWMKRARALEGTEELDRLSLVELRDMIGVMEVALKRAKNALSYQEQEDLKKL